MTESLNRQTDMEEKDLIKSFSKNLSREIANRKTFDVDEVAFAIQNRIEDCIEMLTESAINKEEKKYQALLKKAHELMLQKKQREYVLIGYDLKKAKDRVRLMNIYLDQKRKNANFYKLVELIKSEFGKEKASQMRDEAIAKSQKSVQEHLLNLQNYE